MAIQWFHIGIFICYVVRFFPPSKRARLERDWYAFVHFPRHLKASSVPPPTRAYCACALQPRRWKVCITPYFGGKGIARQCRIQPMPNLFQVHAVEEEERADMAVEDAARRYRGAEPLRAGAQFVRTPIGVATVEHCVLA